MEEMETRVLEAVPGGLGLLSLLSLKIKAVVGETQCGHQFWFSGAEDIPRRQAGHSVLKLEKFQASMVASHPRGSPTPYTPTPPDI